MKSQSKLINFNSRKSWWRHQMETFSALLAICAGNSPVAGEFPAQSQWRGALMFSLICVWINGWVNNREAGDLRRCRAHYDVTVMCIWKCRLEMAAILSRLHCVNKRIPKVYLDVITYLRPVLNVARVQDVYHVLCLVLQTSIVIVGPNQTHVGSSPAR